MSTILLFKFLGNKHDVYRDKSPMKKFSEFLTEDTMEIISFKEKKNEVINKRTAVII